MKSTGPRLPRRALRTPSALLPLVALGAAAVVAMAAPASATNEFPATTPTLATQMSGVDGGPLITDYAYVTGVTYLPTGTVTFSFYGPDDATCSTTPVFVDTQPLVGLISNPLRGEADSAYYTYSQAGVYRSIASYSGDANNVPVVGACNDPGESVVADKFEPAIMSEMSPDTAVGSPLFDTAWIAGAVNPTAAMHFAYYAPTDLTCTGTPVFEADAALVPLDAPLPYWVNATHKAVSPAFTATTTGTYRAIASYPGDANNEPYSPECNAWDEDAAVAQFATTLTSQMSEAVELGGQIHDTAHIAGYGALSGTVEFAYYGPDDATCSKPAVFTTTSAVGASGQSASAAFAPSAAGTYRAIASFSGDALNAPVSGLCNDANESVVVTEPVPAVTFEVEAADPAPPVQVAVLASTGSSTTSAALIGAGVLALGLALLMAARRRAA